MFRSAVVWIQGKGESSQGDNVFKGPEAGYIKAGVENVRKGRVGDDAEEAGKEQMKPWSRGDKTKYKRQ